MDPKLESALEDARAWTDEERRQYMEEMDEHPLLMGPSEKAAVNASLNASVAAASSSSSSSTSTSSSSAPAAGDGFDKNSYVAALRNLAYDDIDTPEALARDAKRKGNLAFERGADFYGQAIRFFRECVEHAGKATHSLPEMRELGSVAHANLAAIHLARKKPLMAQSACESALRLNPRNVKALYRAARACITSGRPLPARVFCDVGLSIEPENAPLKEYRATVAAACAAADKHLEEGRKRIEEQVQSFDAVRRACRDRNIRIGPCLYKSLRNSEAQPYLEGGYGVSGSETKESAPPSSGSSPPEIAGLLHWPVLLLYPEYRTSDWLGDVAEVASIGDILAAVLPSSVGSGSSVRGREEGDNPPRPPWDARGSYTREGVDVFYASDPSKPVSLHRAWREYAASHLRATSFSSSPSLNSSAASESSNASSTSSSSSSSTASASSSGSSTASALTGPAPPFTSISSAALASSIEDDADDVVPPAQMDWALSSKLIRVPAAAPLMLPLIQKDYIVADVPVFYVIARSSPLHEELRRRAGGRFAEMYVPELPPPPSS